jgi:hypothetical protein
VNIATIIVANKKIEINILNILTMNAVLVIDNGDSEPLVE